MSDKTYIRLLALLLILAFPAMVKGQEFAVKTNALYWLTATPNVGIEWKMADRWSLSGVVGYNPFNLPNRQKADGTPANPKLHHFLFMPEGKYWFCDVFERSYVGVHLIGAQYNAGGVKLPFFKSFADKRYDGWAAGIGASYGYQWALGSSWGIELSLGVGYIYFNYRRYDCGACGRERGRHHRNYVGPTKAALSISYLIR